MPLMTDFPGLCQALVEHTGQAFFAFDPVADQFAFTNSAFQAQFQIQTEHSTAASLLAMVHQDDRLYVTERLEKAMEPGISKQFEFRITFAGQAEQWVCLTAALLEEEPGQRLIIGHAEDITAQRHYNDYLKKFSNKKNSTLNILAHDLAGPMGMIHSLSELLPDLLGPEGDGEALHVIGLIEKSSQKGSALIREFLDQEFLESAQTEVITRRANLAEKLRETMEDYLDPKGELIDKRVNFQTSSWEIYAEVDDIKLMQAVSNLISNALKFTPDGGTITVSLEEETGHVLLKVADTGIGIPPEYHATLFDKFIEARRPGLKGEDSVGLGMSIIKTIVEWHRGDIWFESEENQGTTFFIRIPKE